MKQSTTAVTEWQDVQCPICPAGTEASPILNCRDRLRDQDESIYQLVKCSGCDLVFLNPRPHAEMLASAHSDEGYDPFISLKQRESLVDRIYTKARQWTLSWKKNLINQLVNPGSTVLDGGCGTAEFLNALKDTYNVEGFEPDPNAASWGRDNYHLPIQTGDLHSISLNNEHFDLVTLWHVLEHVPDPVSDVKKIASILKAGGFLLIAVPNISSFDARFYGKDWVAIDAPRHLWHFTESQIARLAEIAGFKIYRTGMLPLDPFYNVLMSEQLHLKSGNRFRLALSPLRMGFAVTGSLVNGLFSGNHSSRFYILKKI